MYYVIKQYSQAIFNGKKWMLKPQVLSWAPQLKLHPCWLGANQDTQWLRDLHVQLKLHQKTIYTIVLLKICHNRRSAISSLCNLSCCKFIGRQEKVRKCQWLFHRLATPTEYILIPSQIPFLPKTQYNSNAHVKEELEKGRRVYGLGVVSNYPR